ncbi:fucose permease [Kribbella antiqua]|uniref:Fucose permease n=1 Tax=Kribbella antiqua TaxID=2512217 RepID=A0A4R2J314_9ACTN|nr:MFS transporter [Kribbella antiqua]TCO51248.1 fucose permease [Kribbella antiqua]
MNKARWSVTAVFFVNGCLVSSYISRIPSLKVEYQLSESALGVVLTVFGAAALVSMQFVGGLVARFGSRQLIRIALALLPLLLIAVGHARGVVQLSIALVLMGLVHGAVDVSMNAHAVAVERSRGAPIMNGCHAAWSISAVLASLVGAAVTRAGVGLGTHFLYAGIALLIAGFCATHGLLPSSADRARTATSGKRAWTTGWTRPVLIFGAMGFVVMIGEAAVISWSGVLLHESRGAGLATAGLAFTAYTAFQTVGRLVGDRLTSRYGAHVVFRAGAVISISGLVVVIAVPLWLVSIGGFALVGLGGSVLMPLVFSAVGRVGGDAAAAAVSRLTTFTYAGILIGPAVVGSFAGAVGLVWTFAGLVPLLLVVAANSRLMSVRSAVSEVSETPLTSGER